MIETIQKFNLFDYLFDQNAYKKIIKFFNFDKIVKNIVKCAIE